MEIWQKISKIIESESDSQWNATKLAEFCEYCEILLDVIKFC